MTIKEFFGKTKNEYFKRRIWFSAVLSLIFGLCLEIGTKLELFGKAFQGNGWGILADLGIVLALEIVLFPIFYCLFYVCENAKGISVQRKSRAKLLCIFGVTFLGLFLLWIPAFLAYYPCVMSSDFDVQISQILAGHSAFTNHHPFISTLEIELFYKLGLLLGAPRKGLALLGLFHLSVMAFALSYMLTTIYRLTGKMWLIITLGLLMAIYPINPIMTLSTTKDVVFSALFVIFVTLLINHYFSENGWTITYAILIIITGTLMCLYRNNAVYALVPTAIILFFITSKNTRLKMVLVLLGIVVLSKLSQFGLSKALGASNERDSVEMHSVIIQTFARTYLYDADSLSAEDKEIIERYLPKDSIEKYHPALSDPIKTPVSLETFETAWDGHMPEVFCDWLKVGFRHLGTYADAFLDLTRGYWYLNDTSFATVYGDKLEDRMGILYTFNASGDYDMSLIYHESKAPKLEMIYEKLLSRNDCLKIPVIRVFFRLSTYVWLLLFTFVMTIYKKEPKKLAFTVFPIIYFATMLLGPTAYVRYVFPIMLSLPLLICSLFIENRE